MCWILLLSWVFSKLSPCYIFRLFFLFSFIFVFFPSFPLSILYFSFFSFLVSVFTLGLFSIHSSKLSSMLHCALLFFLDRGLFKRKLAVVRDGKLRLRDSRWDSETHAETPRLTLRHKVFHVSICIYHFIHSHISVQPCDCFRLFSQVQPVQRIFDWRFSQGLICNINSDFLLLINNQSKSRFLSPSLQLI